MTVRPVFVALAAAAAMLANVVSGCAGQRPAQAVGSVPGARAVLVAVAPARVGDVTRTVTVGGRIAAVTNVPVAARAGGRVTEVRADLGQVVRRGDTLVVLDSPELEAQVQAAEAALARAQAELDSARLTAQRSEALFAQGGLSRQQLDQARASLQTAEAQVRSAAASLQVARSNYANSMIVAPTDGVIGSRSVEPGQVISSGAALLTVVDLRRVKVEASVGEAEALRLKPGAELRLRVPSLGEKLFPARLAAIAPAADPRTRSFPIRVELENPDEQLKDGLYAEIVLATETRRGLVLIPANALVQRGTRQVAYVVDGERASERRVEVGLLSGAEAEIIEGIRAGEQVVIAGQNLLVDGAPVRLSGGGGSGGAGGVSPGGGAPGRGQPGGPPGGRPPAGAQQDGQQRGSGGARRGGPATTPAPGPQGGGSP